MRRVPEKAIAPIGPRLDHSNKKEVGLEFPIVVSLCRQPMSLRHPFPGQMEDVKLMVRDAGQGHVLS